MVRLMTWYGEQKSLASERKPGWLAVVLAAGLAVACLLLFLISQRWPYLLLAIWLGGWLWLKRRALLNKDEGLIFYAVTIVLPFLMALILAVAPFYGNGIHLRPESDIRQSLVDVTKHVPFRWAPCGGLLYEMAGFFHIFTPLITLLALPAFARTLYSNRHSIGFNWRGMWLAMVGVVLIIYLYFLKDWMIICIWLSD